MRRICVFTVSGEIDNVAPMSLLVPPSATPHMTCISRADNGTITITPCFVAEHESGDSEEGVGYCDDVE